MTRHIFIIAGESSGDRLGADLMRHLPSDVAVMGVGGPKMRAVGMSTLFPMEELQVMGFVDVVFALPRLIGKFRTVLKAILEQNPPVVVTIDYPGFNLRLAKALRKKGFKGKICHYICPSVWAWGKSRIQLMEAHLDLLLSVLPFEKNYFSKLTVEYIGHPLSHIQPREGKPQNLIALFPGSRSHEIKKNLPYLMFVKEAFPQYDFVLSLSQEKYRPLLQSANIPLVSPTDLQALHPLLAIAKSGTITLELALAQIPTVVVYAISKLDTFLARCIFKIDLPYYALPNLIAQKEVFPELFGPALTPETLVKTVKQLLDNREPTLEACRDLKKLLDTKNSSCKAAELILSLIER
jgi:lipid-A-disaccharide synthase